MRLAIDFDGTITDDSFSRETGVFRTCPFRKDFLKYLPLIAKSHSLYILTARWKQKHYDEVQQLLEEIDYLKYFEDVTNVKKPVDFYFDDRANIIDWETLYNTLQIVKDPDDIAETYTVELLKKLQS